MTRWLSRGKNHGGGACRRDKRSEESRSERSAAKMPDARRSRAWKQSGGDVARHGRCSADHRNAVGGASAAFRQAGFFANEGTRAIRAQRQLSGGREARGKPSYCLTIAQVFWRKRDRHRFQECFPTLLSNNAHQYYAPKRRAKRQKPRGLERIAKHSTQAHLIDVLTSGPIPFPTNVVGLPCLDVWGKVFHIYGLLLHHDLAQSYLISLREIR